MIKKIISFVKKTLNFLIDLVFGVLSFVFKAIKSFCAKIIAVFKL